MTAAPSFAKASQARETRKVRMGLVQLGEVNLPSPRY